jgi:spermine oxidase
MVKVNPYSCLLGLIICGLQVVTCVDNPVVVVGGGFAGLAAANYLLNTLGFTKVTVIEASDRIGGRVKPVQNPLGSGFFDVGAGYIHGRIFNPVYDSANTLNALATAAETTAKDNKQTVWYTDLGCKVDGLLLDSVRQMLNYLYDQVLTKSGQAGQTSSVGALFTAEYQAYKASSGANWGQAQTFYESALDSIAKKEVDTDMSSFDWMTVSPKSWKSFDEPPEDAQIYLGINGHKPILDDLYTKIKSTNIKFKTEVKKITYADNAQVQLQLSDGTTMAADHVIVTPSLGYLKANSASLFSPALPSDIMSAINGIGFNSINKIFLVYTAPFWAADFGKEYLYRVKNSPWNCSSSNVAESDVSKIFWYFEVHPTLPNVLEGVIAGGTDPKLLEACNEGRLIMGATEALRRFTNNNKIPFAKKAIWSAWDSDKLFLGAQSFYTTDCDKVATCNAITLQKPVTVTRNAKSTPVVLLAGEATAEDLYGTTQGAWLQGERAAQAIADFYNPPAQAPVRQV